MVAARAVVLAGWRRAGPLALFAVAEMMALAAFFSVRNMALAAIAVSGPLACRLAVLHARRPDAVAPRPWRPASHFATLALAGALALSGRLLSRRLPPDHT